MTTKREHNIRIAEKRNKHRLRKKRWAKEQRRKRSGAHKAGRET